MQVSKCLGQSCALSVMSNFAKIRPDMTSKTRSYLSNQRSWRLKSFRTSGEKLEMQLHKKNQLSILNSVGCPVQLRKTTWGGQPPPPLCGRGRISTLVPMVRARFEPRCGRPHTAPTHNGVRVSVAGTAQRPGGVSGRRGPCPAYRAR